ncbi:MAG: hemerythrin domain-containing protein [Alphaproteobacteria bacterium]|nr:hemerythrin domain-containing protein [Alphaproteobacteria bacterium]
MASELPEHLQLDARTAVPAELAFLRSEYPRESWDGHPNNGQWCQFWLARHTMFRDFGAGLTDACEKLDAGQVDGPAFHDWFMPRASFYLGELDTHHKVEEYHYFPLLARADPRMETGVALLEGDHHVIHDRLRLVYDGVVALEEAIRKGEGDIATLAPKLRDDLVLLDASLRRHLDDEEDLVVPLILDRGEAGLGMH